MNERAAGAYGILAALALTGVLGFLLQLPVLGVLWGGDIDLARVVSAATSLTWLVVSAVLVLRAAARPTRAPRSWLVPGVLALCALGGPLLRQGAGAAQSLVVARQLPLESVADWSRFSTYSAVATSFGWTLVMTAALVVAYARSRAATRRDPETDPLHE